MFIRKYFEAIYHDTHDEKIVLLTGARQVGKTTLMRQIQDRLEQDRHETVWLSLEDPDILRVLDSHPRELLSLIGSRSEKIYVCIDEFQYLRDPSGFLKYHSDLSGDRVKIIATGSSAFYLDTKFHDSLAGRKWLHEILPLDFSEWLGITGQEHLVRDTLEVARNTSYMRSGEILRLYEEYILYGGYP